MQSAAYNAQQIVDLAIAGQAQARLTETRGKHRFYRIRVDGREWGTIRVLASASGNLDAAIERQARA